MKKLLYLLLFGTLTIGGSMTLNSCGSDDSAIPVPTPEPQPEPQPETKTLVVTASESEVYLGETVTLTATLDGQDVTSGTTFYVDEVAITGNTVTSSSSSSMLIKGKYPNANDSQYVQVNFVENPFLSIEGDGVFIYNGTTYEVNAGLIQILGYRPDDNGGATIVWAQYGWSGNNPDTADNFVVITFETPATFVSGQVTDYELPNASNSIYKSIGFATLNGIDVIADEYTGGNGTVVYNSFNDSANPVTADFNIQITGTHNVSYIYEGDVSASSGAKSAAKTKISKVETKVYEQLKMNRSNLLFKNIK